MGLTGTTRAGRDPRDAHERLERPEAYPGLPRRRGAWRSLRSWRHEAFGDLRSWAVLQAGGAHLLRRVVWARWRPAASRCGSRRRPTTG